MASSPTKDGRRVLGDKSINASLTPSKNRNIAGKGLLETSPVKPLRESLMPHTSLAPAPLVHAGQKRSIDQVDSVEKRDPSTTSSFPSSSQPLREDEFHIYEENTQNTTKSDQLAAMAEMTVERSQPVIQTNTLPSSQESLDMSTMIHLSQSDGGSPQTKTRNIATDANTRQEFIRQKANLLRTRLQVAARGLNKQTQIDRRLTEFEAYSNKRAKMTSQILVTPTTSRAVDLVPSSTPKAISPKLLPAPQLQPVDTSHFAPDALPSSPPASAGGEAREDSKDTDDMATPRQSAVRRHPKTPGSPVQLSSPPGTAERLDDTAKTTLTERSTADVERVAASLKQGEALNGLLKLMETTSEPDLPTA